MVEPPVLLSFVPERGGILVVEDEPVFAADLAQAFEEAGVLVAGVAPSVTAALGLIAEAHWLTGAVLDVSLRGEMAFRVADELVRRDVPFVFTTGCDTGAIPARFALVTCCQKPVDAAQIVLLLLAQEVQQDWPEALRLPRRPGSNAA